MVARIVTTDSWPIEGAQLDALDMTLVQRHITTAQSEGRYSGPITPLAYLRHNQLVMDSASGTVPTLAGILAFGTEPERWLRASCGIDIAEFRSNSSTTKSLNFIEQVRGPLFTVVDRATDILWARIQHDYQFEGAQRVEQHAYTQVVLRELTVNALCHRDWSNTSSRVRIQIFPYFIEWISPGGLPDGVTVDNLLDAQSSRNPALVNVMFQAHYIEGLGLGFDSVYSALAENGVEPPLISPSPTSLTIRVMAKPIGANQKQLSATPPDRQRVILSLIAQQGSVTISDLEKAMGIIRRTIQRDLHLLLDQGDIEVAGATNNRHYKLRQK